ncbi:hypothetical protein AQZ52_17310 [Novosphingobium fuchskuhlense]|uniref:SpaA-like prealbumin fold domain-containing protein n=1 Tax=Novosphingobium fuchskuhlense TaxID=1117702 RepID=A0A117UTG1_9SPHN|nr:CshA/CshB family fibrillar adhesin-related protein [Novosphingobium fuchskuhlense]KUR70556.1 hypothetical protein AQZ52_17310 [Novosphingobium fuchskuhlense]
MTCGLFRQFAALLLAFLLLGLGAERAEAASCYYATSQGSTGPANWASYCWLDFSGYNDTAARSAAGQAMSYTLPDGTVMTFTLKISGAAIGGAAAPSWSGAAIGNTAFLGVGGRPILYQTAAGTTTAAISNIVLTPPAGVSQITSYMFVAADGESSNEGESLAFTTNGGNWVALDNAGPISGTTYPTSTGLGTQTFTVTGVPNTVGANIVGSSTPTSLNTTIVGGGLQGVMFAVRFASIKLNLQLTGVRASAADQFTFNINATSGGSTLASGTSSGTGNGPFTAATLTTASALPLTLTQSMAAGSANPLTDYRSSLTCTNSVSSSTPLPSGVITTNFSFGALQFGDLVTCTFTNTVFPHLQLTKALGTGGRRFNTDQFVMNINQGSTTVATTTTTGTTTTVTNGTTPQVMVSAGTAYAFTEVGAGTTSLTQYTAAMTCTNASTGSTTTLPTAAGGTVTPQMGDVISCTITNTRRASNATLTLVKTSSVLSDPVNGTTNPKMIPGAIVQYSILVSNTGPTAVDNNSVLLIDSLPSQMLVGTAATPTFTQGTPTSGLTFTAGTDIRYSNAASAPTTFAGCTYSPTTAYDAAVKFICVNPKGTMAGSTGTPPNFTISFRAQMQ